MLAQQWHTCSAVCKKSTGIRQNKLPVDVVGGWCQSRSIKLGVLIPLKRHVLPTVWQRQF